MTRLFVPRKSAPKSRGGCLTCKIRHIKCDESRPNCLKCTSTGRKCDGYVAMTQSATAIILPYSNTPAVAINDLPGGRLERRSFDFFRSCTVPNISLLFGTPPWTRLVLQASHSEPALQHAVTALGALHEHLESQRYLGDFDITHKNSNAVYAAQQYAQALTCLRNLFAKPDSRSIELALIGALMCIYYEVLQENWQIAQVHLENCLNVLKPLLPSEDSWLTNALETKMRITNHIDDDVVQAFAQLDIEAACTLGHRHPTMCIVATTLDIPIPFISISQARHLLFGLTSQLHSFMRSTADDYKSNILPIPLPTVAEANFLQTRLKEWESSFSAFLNDPSTKLSRQEQQAANILSIQHKVTYMKAATCLYAEEMIFDQFDQEFEEILCLADYLLLTTRPTNTITSTGSSSSTNKVVLTFGMGIIEALVWTAIKCRSPSIRRRAIDILRKVTWQEGVWNAEMMAAVAEKFVRMEEEGLENGGWRIRGNNNGDDEVRVSECWRLHEHGWGMDLTRRRTNVGAMRRENGVDGEWTLYQEEAVW